jgi:putative ABC transport system permease protein
MLNAPIGVVSTDVVGARMQLSGGSYTKWPDVQQFYATLVQSISAQPGVEAVGAGTALPLDAAWATRLPFRVEGSAAPPIDNPVAQHVSVMPGYFETFRVRPTAGRLFAFSDTSDTEPVIVVNQTFARRVFPGEDAVGKRIVSTATRIGPLGFNLAGTVPFRIVGVVSDIQHAALGRPPEAVIYHTSRQFPYRPMHLVARGPDRAVVTAALRNALRALDPSLPLSQVRTMDERVLAAAAAPRLLMSVLSAFAVVTAALAAIGVYGLLACVVNDRRRELAIRLALGAKPSALATRITAHGLLLAGAGVFAGLVITQLLFAALLRDVLFQTRANDPVAMIAAGVLLLAAAAVACAAPARRAASVEPLEGLRLEG